MDVDGYLSFYNLATFVDGKVRNMPKVSKLCTGSVHEVTGSKKYLTFPSSAYLFPTEHSMKILCKSEHFPQRYNKKRETQPKLKNTLTKSKIP